MKILFIIIYILGALLCLLSGFIKFGAGMIIIPVFIGLIKLSQNLIEKRRYKNFIKEGSNKYAELMEANKKWREKFIEVDCVINKLTASMLSPYNSRLYPDLNLLVENVNKYRQLAEEESNFLRELRQLRGHYGIKFDKYDRLSEFGDQRILKLYLNIIDSFCEKTKTGADVSTEELEFLFSFENALRLNKFDSSDVYIYWKSFGKNKKKYLLSDLFDRVIKNESISEGQENYLYKISVILTYKDEPIEKQFPQKVKIISDLSLARKLGTKQISPINQKLPFGLNKNEECYFSVNSAKFSKTRSEDSKYYPSGNQDECQVFVTNQRFIIWGLTTKSYSLSAISGIGITDHQYFIFKIRTNTWPFCIELSKPYALQAIVNRCINL